MVESAMNVGLIGIEFIVEIRLYICNCSWIFNQNHKTQTYSTTLQTLIHNLEQKSHTYKKK